MSESTSQGESVRVRRLKTAEIASPAPESRRIPWLGLIISACLFGWLEAVLVRDLRYFLDPQGLAFPLVRLPADLASFEMWREVATVALLACIAHMALWTANARFAAFLLLFGAWDLAYYAGLWVMMGWPDHLLTWDLLFLVPVAWMSPVLAPMLVATAMLGAGITALRYTAGRGDFVARIGHYLAAVTGGLLVIGSFVEDAAARRLEQVPNEFAWEVFALGLLIALSAFIHAVRLNR